MDLTSLILFAGALLVAAGSPGPSIAALVSRVLTSGHQFVLPFLAAMWIGEAVWLTFAVFGLASVAATFHVAFVAIKWLGVVYLLYLAWKMWTAPARPEEGSLPSHGSAPAMFLTGLAVTLGNPKIMVFYLALLPTLVDLDRLTLAGWSELVLVMLVVLIAVDLAWVILAVRARLLLRSPVAMRLANRCCAGLMAGAAGAIASR